MGGHYGSVQVRTQDRDKVSQAAEQVATKLKIKCLLGPAIDGWVGIYPEHNGQDQSFGQAIARLLDDDVLHLLVHDDDIFAYWLWRAGELVDSFWSAPGYFGDEDEEEQQRMTGNPDAFASLIGDNVADLRELLIRESGRYPFEVERLNEFAKLLRIPNAVAAYEYLKAGEIDEMDRWDEFQELPTRSKSASKKKKASKRKPDEVALEKQRLMEQGLLLADVIERKQRPFACAAGDGFVVAWDGLWTGQRRIEYHLPPWDAPIELPIELDAQITCLAASPSGRFFATAIVPHVVVWEVEGRRRANQITDIGACLALSWNGDLVACAGPEELRIIDMEQNRQIFSAPVPASKTVAIHPSGRWFAAAGVALDILRIDSEAVRRRFFPGGRSHAAWLAAIVPGETEISVDRVESVGFSRDGKWFWTGSTRGLSVYDADSVLAADGDELPAPVWQYTPNLMDGKISLGDVYHITEEAGKNCILFGGLAGRVYRMDLQLGAVTELLALPGIYSILRLDLASDAGAIGITLMARAHDVLQGKVKDHFAWQAWSSRALKTDSQHLP